MEIKLQYICVCVCVCVRVRARAHGKLNEKPEVNEVN